MESKCCSGKCLVHMYRQVSSHMFALRVCFYVTGIGLAALGFRVK